MKVARGYVLVGALLGLHPQSADAISSEYRDLVITNTEFSKDYLEGVLYPTGLLDEFETLNSTLYEGASTEALRDMMRKVLDLVETKLKGVDAFLERLPDHTDEWLDENGATVETLNKFAHTLWFHEKFSQWSLNTNHKHMAKVAKYLDTTIDTLLAEVPATKTSHVELALGGPKESKLKSILPPFETMKSLGISAAYDILANVKNSPEAFYKKDYILGHITNVYEAVWNPNSKFKEKMQPLGNALIHLFHHLHENQDGQAYLCKDDETKICLSSLSDEYIALYTQWNLIFTQEFGDSPGWAATLLYPGILGAKSERWYFQRVESLLLKTKLFVFQKLQRQRDVNFLSDEGMRELSATVFKTTVTNAPKTSFLRYGKWPHWDDITINPPKNNVKESEMPSAKAETANWFAYFDKIYPPVGLVAKAKIIVNKIRALRGTRKYVKEYAHAHSVVADEIASYESDSVEPLFLTI
jgi:hypothetical protein